MYIWQQLDGGDSVIDTSEILQHSDGVIFSLSLFSL
jgi:hypothetical protein